MRQKQIRVVIANQKGGVAKTTTSTALAEAFAEQGKRVLLIDTDPQCNASQTFSVTIDGATTLYDVLINSSSIAEAVQHAANIDVLPCDPLLSGADAQIVKLGKEYLLRNALTAVQDLYDYCIIDTPPSLGILLINALTAADQVIVPLTADAYSLDGLSALIDTTSQIRMYTNPRLAVPQLLLTRWSSRTKLSRRFAEDLPNIANELTVDVLPARVRECVAARQAQDQRCGLLAYAPRSTTAEDYRTVAHYITERGV